MWYEFSSLMFYILKLQAQNRLTDLLGCSSFACVPQLKQAEQGKGEHPLAPPTPPCKNIPVSALNHWLRMLIGRHFSVMSLRHKPAAGCPGRMWASFYYTDRYSSCVRLFRLKLMRIEIGT